MLVEISKRRRAILIGALLVSSWLCVMVFLHQLLLDLPSAETLQHYAPPVVTRIYDVHGEVITELFTERRTLTPLNEIPMHLQNAFRATEDEHFYQHWGINIRGIARAFLADLRHGRVV